MIKRKMGKREEVCFSLWCNVNNKVFVLISLQVCLHYLFLGVCVSMY